MHRVTKKPLKSAVKKYAIVGLFSTVASVGGVFAYGDSETDNLMEDAVVADSSFDPDAIVVLTGGSGRIDTAFDLLRPEQKLLISGANPKTTFEEMLASIGQDPAEIDPAYITFSARARDTIGNALEIREWLENNSDVKSVLIITSDYHAARTLLELQLAQAIPADVNVRFHLVSNDEPPLETKVLERLRVGLRAWSVTSPIYTSFKDHLREEDAEESALTAFQP